MANSWDEDEQYDENGEPLAPETAADDEAEGVSAPERGNPQPTPVPPQASIAELANLPSGVNAFPPQVDTSLAGAPPPTPPAPSRAAQLYAQGPPAPPHPGILRRLGAGALGFAQGYINSTAGRPGGVTRPVDARAGIANVLGTTGYQNKMAQWLQQVKLAEASDTLQEKSRDADIRKAEADARVGYLNANARSLDDSRKANADARNQANLNRFDAQGGELMTEDQANPQTQQTIKAPMLPNIEPDTPEGITGEAQAPPTPPPSFPGSATARNPVGPQQPPPPLAPPTGQFTQPPPAPPTLSSIPKPPPLSGDISAAVRGAPGTVQKPAGYNQVPVPPGSPPWAKAAVVPSAATRAGQTGKTVLLTRDMADMYKEAGATGVDDLVNTQVPWQTINSLNQIVKQGLKPKAGSNLPPELSFFQQNWAQTKGKTPDQLSPQENIAMLGAYASSKADPQTRALAQTMKEAQLATLGNTRSDNSYKFNVGEVDKIAAPLRQMNDRMTRLQTTLAQGTPQADALVAPELLSALAGGAGSGVRMNEAEIARIVGGRSAWQNLKASMQHWSLDPTAARSITPAQQQQIRTLTDAVAQHYSQQLGLLNSAYSQLSSTQDPLEHRRIVDTARRQFSAPDQPQAPVAAPAAAAATDGKPSLDSLIPLH